MALPTLNATFASAADLPRRMMLAKWLVEELGETQAPSSVLVSGAGTTTSNGIYTFYGQGNGKNEYIYGENSIYWQDINWSLYDDSLGQISYVLQEDVQFPWLGSWTDDNGIAPFPTVTEIPAVNPIANYVSLPERYLWAKIAVAAGGPKTEADYISLPKQYVWKAIYDAVSGSSAGTTDWSEKQALGHIAAAYRGDTANPANLATYINWPWRYQVASIITSLATPTTFNAVIVSGAGSSGVNGIYQFTGNVFNGKNSYADDQGNTIAWYSFWNIYSAEIGDDAYLSYSDTEFPWQATGWEIINGSNPVPTLTPTNV